MSFKSCSDASSITSHQHIKAAQFFQLFEQKVGGLSPPLQNVGGDGLVLLSPRNYTYAILVYVVSHLWLIRRNASSD
jgi:hypothetical protein